MKTLKRVSIFALLAAFTSTHALPVAAAEKQRALRSLKPYGLPGVVVEPSRRLNVVNGQETYDLFVPGIPSKLDAQSLSKLGESIPTPAACKASGLEDAFFEGMNEAGTLKIALFQILSLNPDGIQTSAQPNLACQAQLFHAKGDARDLPISKTLSRLGCCRLGFITWQNVLRKHVIYRNDPNNMMNMRLPADGDSLARKCQREYKRGASLACFAAKGGTPGKDNPLPGCLQMGFEDFSPASNQPATDIKAAYFADYDEDKIDVLGDPRCARDEFTPPTWEDAVKPGKVPAHPRFPEEPASVAGAGSAG